MDFRGLIGLPVQHRDFWGMPLGFLSAPSPTTITENWHVKPGAIPAKPLLFKAKGRDLMPQLPLVEESFRLSRHLAR